MPFPYRFLPIALFLAGSLLWTTTLLAQSPPTVTARCHGNPIINGSFETLPHDVPSHDYFPSIDGWRVVAGDADELEIQNQLYPPVPDGDHYLELASDAEYSVAQKFATQAGHTYSLSLAYRPRPGYDSRMRILWNDKPVGALPQSGGSSTWARYSFQVAGTGYDKLTLVGVKDSQSPAGGALVDDLSLCRLPLTSPGVAEGCCCGDSVLHAFNDSYPRLNWGIHESGHLVRFWWDQTSFEELVPLPPGSGKLVAGSLHHDPFGDGVVALTDSGQVVRAFHNGNAWTAELVSGRVKGFRPARLCGLTTSLRGDHRGIWVIAERHVLWIHRTGTSWDLFAVSIGDHGYRMVPSSLHEIWNGRIAGLLRDGRRWGIWFENNDPQKIRFDVGDSPIMAPPVVRNCAMSPPVGGLRSTRRP